MSNLRPSPGARIEPPLPKSEDALVRLDVACPPGLPAFLKRLGIRWQKRKHDTFSGGTLYTEPWVARVVQLCGWYNELVFFPAIAHAARDEQWKSALLTVAAAFPENGRGVSTALIDFVLATCEGAALGKRTNAAGRGKESAMPDPNETPPTTPMPTRPAPDAPGTPPDPGAVEPSEEDLPETD
jgi:hypothetical protein